MDTSCHGSGVPVPDMLVVLVSVLGINKRLTPSKKHLICSIGNTIDANRQCVGVAEIEVRKQIMNWK